MGYSENFRKLVELCTEQNLYIGTGNPNAKILIIGKECAHNFLSEELKTEDLLRAEEQEVKINIDGWIKALEKPIELDEIEDCICKKDDGKYKFISSKYNVCYPFKGQLKKINKNDNGGTSPTWVNYQSLIDKISDNKPSNKIDFHKNCFITEINQIPSPNSSLLDKYVPEEVKKIVDKRKDEFFTHNYFKQFNIIVIASANYPQRSGWDFKKTFDVEFIEDGEKKDEKGNKFWIHTNQDKSKLLIQTRQQSRGFFYALHEVIAEQCKPYLNKKIHLNTHK